MKADKGDPVKMYGVEGACLGIATIASVEEINNPLPEGTKLSNFCIDDGDKQYTTKVRFLCTHHPMQRALFGPLNALRKALQIFCIFVSIAPESCASPALQDMQLPGPCDHQRCTPCAFSQDLLVSCNMHLRTAQARSNDSLIIMDGKSPFMKDVMKEIESQSAEFALVCTLTSTFSSIFNP